MNIRIGQKPGSSAFESIPINPTVVFYLRYVNGSHQHIAYKYDPITGVFTAVRTSNVQVSDTGSNIWITIDSVLALKVKDDNAAIGIMSAAVITDRGISGPRVEFVRESLNGEMVLAQVGANGRFYCHSITETATMGTGTDLFRFRVDGFGGPDLLVATLGVAGLKVKKIIDRLRHDSQFISYGNTTRTFGE